MDGTGSWEQGKVGIILEIFYNFCDHMTCLCHMITRRCEYCGSPESAVKHALHYMTELVTTSTSPDGRQDQLRIEPILKLPMVMGLSHLSNQCVQVFLMESIFGE